MARWLRITLIVVVLLLVAAAAPTIGISATAIRRARFPPTASTSRRSAPRPTNCRAARRATSASRTSRRFSFPAVASVGGDGFNTVPMAAFSYQVLLPTDTIIIDTGFVRGQGEDMLVADL